MKKHTLTTTLLILPLFLFSQASVELSLGVGSTIVNIDNLIEKDEIESTFATDWGTICYSASGQFLYTTRGNYALGAELMYQNLYWYSVSVPYGSQRIYRDYSVTAIKFTPFLKLGVRNIVSFDMGPEFNFMDELKFGFLISSVYTHHLTKKIDIPVKLRVDLIHNVVLVAPISVNAGIRYRI